MNSVFEEIVEKVLQEPRKSAEALEVLKEDESASFFGFCAAKSLQLETWNAIAVKISSPVIDKLVRLGSTT